MTRHCLETPDLPPVLVFGFFFEIAGTEILDAGGGIVGIAES